MKKYYLKQNIQIEPLINQWYVAPMQISPATGSMIMLNYQIKIMCSYLESPRSHELASKHRSMIGGPIINLETRKTEEIKKLLDNTKYNCGKQIELATAIGSLNSLLKENVHGYTLTDIYALLPKILRGYVELSYDIFNNYSFRIIEPLLYESELSFSAYQSVMFSQVIKDERTFCLSTPILINNEKFQLCSPFNNEVYDEIFKLKYEPQSLGVIESLLESSGVSRTINKEIFKEFLTDIPPNKKPQCYLNDDVRVRYFGHACVLIETKDLSILIDPIISYKYSTDILRFTYEDLPPSIDYLLLTHTHQDHVCVEHLLQLRHRVKNIVVPKANLTSLLDPSLKLLLKHIGYKHVMEIDELESFSLPDGEIIGIPFFGEHGDLNITSKIAYAIKLGGKSFMFAADSNNLSPDMYRNVRAIIGDINVLFLGMECHGAPLSWLYGPMLPPDFPKEMDKSRRLNGSDALAAIDLISCFNCEDVYIYAMGQEPWLSFLTSIDYDENSRPIIESNKVLSYSKSGLFKCERLFGEKEVFYNKDS
jgi:L-ascorbate metabolism protein UlaG (beta-lactamase superfamily)